MRITVTGATGFIGDEVTVLSRRPALARRRLGVEALGCEYALRAMTRWFARISQQNG